MADVSDLRKEIAAADIDNHGKRPAGFLQALSPGIHREYLA